MKRSISQIFIPLIFGFFILGMHINAFASEEYPLQGMYDDYFVMSNNGSFYIMDDGSHVPLEPWLQWKWDDEYILRNLERRYDQRPLEYKVEQAIAANNLLYMSDIPSVAVIAELSGPPWKDYAEKGISQESLGIHQEVITEIKKFYDSFPNWKTATDLEKATRICNWIAQAEYDYDLNDDSYSLYGCLVKKKAVCQGFTSAAELLGVCVGLPVQCLSTVNHAYPIFWVNGVWLANDPTINDNTLSIAQVYSPEYYYGLNYLVHDRGISRDMWLYNWEILYPLLDILEYKGPDAPQDLSFEGYGLNTVLEYCHKTNYTIPETLDRAAFPKQGYAMTYGKNLPVIFIRSIFKEKNN